ncbi:MAG: PadR family transcriptional regulator [Firmicutes bacterium]|nr:PadR family transcriptional regulator [Bacillota bacterium]
MAKINKTRYIILGIVSMKPASGYDIKKWVEETFSFFWDIGYGQIYPTLEGLEKDGLVFKSTQIEDGRPIRHEYEITPAGREELQKWMTLPVEEEKCRYEILVKLFFGYMMPVEENIRIIEEFRDKKLREMELLKKFDYDIQEFINTKPQHVYPLLTLLMGIHSFKSCIDWADEAIGILKQVQKNNEQANNTDNNKQEE